jgi:hypothetical protein
MQNLKNKKVEEPDTKFVSESWVKDFLSIPAEYRVNPFDVSPSGDLFFADKRNLEHIDNALTSIKNGKGREYTPEQIDKLLGL